MLPVGPLAEHNVRTTFAANLLASGGVETVNPGTVGAAGVATALAEAGDPAVVVICGTDARYATDVSDVVAAARAAGVSHVYLAGRRKTLDDFDIPVAGRPDEYLTATIDAIHAMSTFSPDWEPDMTASDIAAGAAPAVKPVIASFADVPLYGERTGEAVTDPLSPNTSRPLLPRTATPPISSTGALPRASTSVRSTSPPTGTPRWWRGTRWTRSPARRRSSAGPTRRCTSTSRGPFGSTPASRPPPSRTRSIAAIWPPARRGCRSPSTWPPTAAMTPTIHGWPVTSEWQAWQSIPFSTCVSCSTASTSPRCRCR